MNPQKKMLQLELAKDIMIAEISGIRASGISGSLNYAELYARALQQATGISDIIEEEAQEVQLIFEELERAKAEELINKAEKDETEQG